MRQLLLPLALFFFSVGIPLSTHAQSGKDSVQGYIVLITQFIGDTLLPVLFAIALLFFLVNAARYFVIDGDDSGSQEKAKTLALYGIGAFVFLVSIWGIVNMFVESFDIDDSAARCPDYLGDWCTTRDAYSGSFNRYQFTNDGSYFNDLSPSRQETFESTDADGNVVGEYDVTVKSYDEEGGIIDPNRNIYIVPDEEEDAVLVPYRDDAYADEANAAGEPYTEEDPIDITDVVPR